MIKKYAIMISLIIGVIGIIFTPVTSSQLGNYKRKEAEYNEQKKSNEEFVKMCEEYKNDYDNLLKKYEQIQKDYEEYQKNIMKILTKLKS